MFSYPHSLSKNNWALKGRWHISAEYVVAKEAEASLKLNFSAQHVFLVLAPESVDVIPVKVLYNGSASNGKDLRDGNLDVRKDTLYEIITLDQFENGEVEIITSKPGLRVYAFTFG